MKHREFPSTIRIPVSAWEVEDLRSGELYPLEVSVDWQGILNLLLRRCLNNRSKKTAVLRGFIKGRVPKENVNVKIGGTNGD